MGEAPAAPDLRRARRGYQGGRPPRRSVRQRLAESPRSCRPSTGNRGRRRHSARTRSVRMRCSTSGSRPGCGVWRGLRSARPRMDRKSSGGALTSAERTALLRPKVGGFRSGQPLRVRSLHPRSLADVIHLRRVMRQDGGPPRPREGHVRGVVVRDGGGPPPCPGIQRHDASRGGSRGLRGGQADDAGELRTGRAAGVRRATLPAVVPVPDLARPTDRRRPTTGHRPASGQPHPRTTGSATRPARRSRGRARR